MSDHLLARIERLEKQNKRIKMAISALCLCLGVLLTTAQKFPKNAGNSMERLEAREIVLNDGVTSAKLTPDSLIFSGKSEFEAEKTTISASGISLSGRYVTEIRPTGLICSRDGVPRFDLSIGEIGAALSFQDGAGLMGTMLDETTMVLKSNDGILSMRPQHIFLQKGEEDAFLNSSSLRIRDADKHQVVLGQAGPIASQTGNAHAAAAASLTFLDKDDTVVWQAP
jgi:hypothetical protein